ncbi:MAG: DUF3298 domain-containing protein [Pseudomonadota bacterium]
MRRLAAILCASVAAPALAQEAPSFDCTKASNVIERTICKTPELAKADRALAAAYAALAGKLKGAARENLEKGQVRWIVNRNRACPDHADGIADCIKESYASRLADLEAFGQGEYPFIIGESLARSGKVGRITWSYAITYPRFDGKTADFDGINRRYAEAARKAADEATPAADAGADREQQWTYEQGYSLYRASPQTVTVARSFYGYSGGAHGYGATDCALVDLRTGKAVGPSGVFRPGEQWLRAMSQIVGADLRKQFTEKPGFDDALEPANLAKILSEPAHYCWQSDRLHMIFNAYEVGPYVSGPFDVEIPYDRLKPLLRPDGPITR